MGRCKHSVRTGEAKREVDSQNAGKSEGAKSKDNQGDTADKGEKEKR